MDNMLLQGIDHVASGLREGAYPGLWQGWCQQQRPELSSLPAPPYSCYPLAPSALQATTPNVNCHIEGGVLVGCHLLHQNGCEWSKKHPFESR